MQLLESITIQEFSSFIVAAAAFLVAWDKINTLFSKPTVTINQKLATDKKRLDNHEILHNSHSEDIKLLKEEMEKFKLASKDTETITLKALHVLIECQINPKDLNKLKVVNEELLEHMLK